MNDAAPGAMSMALSIFIAVLIAATAIILHEVAHGYAALALGDETALKAGRLTLNPVRHVDRVGTLLLPGVLMLAQLLTVGRILFMFGWAKPVPVDARNFKAPRQMMALVALAGPAMNFALAFLAAHAFRFHALPPLAGQIAGQFILLNLALGLFNLLPIPPLDGGRVAVGILPLPIARVWARLENLGLLIVLALIALPSILREAGVAFDPLSFLFGPVLNWAFHAVLWLAGVRDVGL
ncbi:MAG TPA: site-2 protease family protein [Acetobacteraceae bacterium]|nr:site-2 protease family protein [Acetobacteraceae bacterium]